MKSPDSPGRFTFRMLEQLARMGWLRRRGVEYELGDKLVEMGILTLYQNKFDYVVAPLLYELHRITGHAVHLGVLDGTDVLYLQKIETQSGPVLQTRVGGRIPARSSTIGKALLAATPRPNEPSTCARSDLDNDRPLGVAYGTCNTGFNCIGVHIGSMGGAEVGMSVSGPMQQVKLDLSHAAPVRLAAAAIAQYFDLTGDIRRRLDDGSPY
ncbi:IclR family transcriptional regulator [Rhodococcus sp. UNC363MFTsu5.1]|uniref:IclR family transcriptional regulator n=1 Tax=Rhodococcus sp. UNC363MFTsu5.1 TaxID=1449069 RepID=UPI00068AE8CC|nr:hypothetical protein [Rhodococcus sp. UNC363MFTsu5.1]